MIYKCLDYLFGNLDQVYLKGFVDRHISGLTSESNYETYIKIFTKIIAQISKRSSENSINFLIGYTEVATHLADTLKKKILEIPAKESKYQFFVPFLVPLLRQLSKVDKGITQKSFYQDLKYRWFSSCTIAGKGVFGTVSKGVDLKTFETVAIKRITESSKMLVREVQTLQLIRHPNVVRLLNWTVVDEKFYLVMEYCEGTLEKILGGKKEINGSRNS